MATLNIVMNDNKMIYYPGELITGQLNVTNQQALDLKCVEIKFKGEAYVHWEESSGSGENRRTEHYSARETYFKNAVVVYGNGAQPGSTSTVMLAGQNVFPFQYQLPLNLPASFETYAGYVRYSVKAVIRRSGVFSNYKCLCMYTVLDVFDLNEYPNARQPVGVSDSKTICCCCCASGPVEAEVNTDRSGYVPGEYITVNANISNASNTDSPSAELSIIQAVTLHSTTKSRYDNHSFGKVQVLGCQRRSRRQLTNNKVQVCVVIPGCHTNLRVKCPIMIGTVPLQGIVPNATLPFQQITLEQSQYDISMEAVPPGSTQQQSSSAPPPTYASATAFSVKKPNDNGTTSGQETFAPQYAYYDWNQTAFQYNNP